MDSIYDLVQRLRYFIKSFSKFKTVYRISYFDENGNGWKENHPWYCSETFNTIKESKIIKQQLINKGYINVKIKASAL